MKQLTQNIINIHGQQGKAWLADLPATIDALAQHWKLSDITHVENKTFNFVVKAKKDANQPVVVKVSCDEKSIMNEMHALKYFAGDGSVQFLDYHPAFHALLLQQAIPGITLTSLYPAQVDYVMNCYVDTMKKLHHKQLPNDHQYRHISEWLTAIDNLTPTLSCPSSLIEKAISVKNTLLATITAQIFLHGDLHHDNILQHNNQWLAIDPKGIIGEPEFEIAAFDFMYISELANEPNVKNNLETRIKLLAKKSGLDAQRILNWVFVRLMLMAAWQMEDNGDPSSAIKLAAALL